MITGPVAAKDAFLPDGWAVWPLKRLLSSFELGGNYPNSLTPTDYPLMKMGNLGRGRFDLAKIEYVASGTTPIERHRLRRGDVLFNTRNTLDLVGKIAMWREEVECAYFNSNLMRLNFDPEIIVSNEFANLALNSESSISGLRAMATGTTSVAAIYTRDLLTLPVVVPPAKEQQAIAAALSDADGVVAGLERVIAKKRLIKQGAMQDLLTARRRLPGFSGEWEPVNLAKESHLKARIGWQGLTTNEYRDSGEFYLITGTEIVDGRVDWRRCVFVDKWRYDQDRNIQLRNKDVLLTKDGTIGKVAQLRDLPGPAALNSGVFVIRPKSDAYDATFLFHILRSSVFNTFLTKLTAGSTIVHLYQKDLVTFEFLAPEIDEQRAIAAVLSDMDTEIQTLETRLTKARAVKEGMMQNLLTGRVRLV